MVNHVAAPRGFAWLAAMKPGLWIGVVVLLAGCYSIGPGTIVADRFDYSAAISDSWKQQTLLNIVKMRYMDLPVFLDVASIVNGYSLQTAASVNGGLTSRILGDLEKVPWFASADATAVYTDRPTITYVPLTGEKFLQSLLAPIDPKNIFILIQSGYPADFILGLTVDSLNGVRNRSTAGEAIREADPDFLRALQLLREVQAADAVGMRVLEEKKQAVVIFRGNDVPADIARKGAEARRLLKLPADQERFVLVYSPGRGAENELAVKSRSMIQIIQNFASYVDVPEEHLKDHRAIPALGNGLATDRKEGVKIRSGKHKPGSAFAAVRYRGYWFWIDDGDLQAKRLLTVIMFCFTLRESGAEENVPLLTIPAQ